jgi:phosphate transport system substrate-binding protein
VIIRNISRAVASLLVATAVAGAAAANDDKLRIGGAGTALGTLREIGDAYTKVHPNVVVTVLPSLGAVGGVHALRSGAVDIALATRVLTQSEGINEVTPIEIARTPFVFAVNAGNPVSSITHQQLLEIYQMKRTTWPDGSRIRLVLRPPYVSDTLFLKGLSPPWKKAMEELATRPGMLEVATAQEAAAHVEKSPGALTTSTINLIVTEKRAMKALKVDGVEPDAKSIADGSYPFYKPVFLVTLPNPAPSVLNFIAFVRSRAGRDILAHSGNVVLADGR